MHKKSNRFVTVACLCLVLISSIMFLTPKVRSADSEPVMSVTPSSIVDTEMGPGATFRINITVINVTNLYGCQVKLGFNPAVLECTSGVQPSDHIFKGKLYQAPSPMIDNTEGNVLAMVILMGQQPGINVTRGTFYQFDFSVKARGISNLEFLSKNTITYLINPSGQKISFTPVNGYFNNRLPIPTATLSVDPRRVADPALTPCHNFTANITILRAAELNDWQLSVYYKNDILNVTQASEGPFLQSGGSTTFNAMIQNDFNTTHGRVLANCTLPSGSGVTGNGTLVSLVFHVIGLGNTTITLNEVALYDSTGEAIPYSKYDGYFNNMLIAKLIVQPEQIVGPQWIPGTTFTIDIAVTDVENLYGYEFKLGYDGTVLTCYGLLINPLLNTTHYTASFYANDTAGEVWVKLQFYPPAAPIMVYTNTSLVTLFFKVDRVGDTNLHLFDTYLTDPNGDSITHETEDGYFATLIVDIAIVDAVARPTKVYQSWLVNVTVTVANKGNLTETFDVKAYYDNTSIGTLTVPDLAPGEERIINFTWDTTNVQPYYAYNYTISIDVPPLQYELNTADNHFTDGKVQVKLMGDVNSDGVVEMLDFLLMADAFGSYPGQPRWNPDCDLNQDDMVELMDFMLVSNNFGETCPPHP